MLALRPIGADAWESPGLPAHYDCSTQLKPECTVPVLSCGDLDGCCLYATGKLRGWWRPWPTAKHISVSACYGPSRRADGVRKRYGFASHGAIVPLCTRATPSPSRIFRPPSVSVATRTLTSGARRNGRRARDAGRSCRRLPTLELTLALGRPSFKLR